MCGARRRRRHDRDRRADAAPPDDDGGAELGESDGIWVKEGFVSTLPPPSIRRFEAFIIQLCFHRTK